MSKALRKAQRRLQLRVKGHQDSPRTEEGPRKRGSSGGYPLPGSMNRHKG